MQLASNVVILSDTHGMMHAGAWPFIREADEVWHAGDLGPPALLAALREANPNLRAISGNADPRETLHLLPEHLVFTTGGAKVALLHIVGRPGRYTPEARALVEEHRPHILVCGHSHILLVAPVPQYPFLLHINPGAAGHHGFHTICTLIKLRLEAGRVTDMQVVELGGRGRLMKNKE